MKLLLNFSSIFSLLFLFVATAFAHEVEIPHEEPVPAINPVLLVGIVAVLAIGGFILWKFVLSGKKPSTQKKTVSQSGENDGSQKS